MSDNETSPSAEKDGKRVASGFTVLRAEEGGGSLAPIHGGVDATVEVVAAEEAQHDDCGEWCNHCEVCGVGILYGSRCPAHGLSIPAGCDTCGDSGLVPWMVEGDPHSTQEPDGDGMLPCPDCQRAIPAGKDGS